MSPRDRAKAVVAAFKGQGLSDLGLETIIASAITRAIDEEREQCAFLANMENFTRRGNYDYTMGAKTAYADMAMRIRERDRLFA
jgi:hypothetical protein